MRARSGGGEAVRTGKDWAMLSADWPEMKAYTTESNDTRVPAIL